MKKTSILLLNTAIIISLNVIPINAATSTKTAVKTTSSSVTSKVNTTADLYNYVKKQLSAGNTKFKITLGKLSTKYIFKSLDKVLDDININSPELLMGYRTTNYTLVNGIVNVAINYSVGTTETGKMILTANNEANNVIKKVIKPNMSTLEKVKALYDYLTDTVKYDSNDTKYDYSAYGALVKKKAACEGYARSFNLLLSKIGVKSLLVIGTANNSSYTGNHAWNLVNINGKYYHCDATWDIYKNSYSAIWSSESRYDYFMLTDKTIGTNHFWNHKTYPAANATDLESLYSARNSELKCIPDLTYAEVPLSFATRDGKSVKITVPAQQYKNIKDYELCPYFKIKELGPDAYIKGNTLLEVKAKTDAEIENYFRENAY